LDSRQYILPGTIKAVGSAGEIYDLRFTHEQLPSKILLTTNCFWLFDKSLRKARMNPASCCTKAALGAREEADLPQDQWNAPDDGTERRVESCLGTRRIAAPLPPKERCVGKPRSRKASGLFCAAPSPRD
jgi:hypothetical protein